MYDITLVFTHHSENGKCNSDELHKIIESIEPEVVFEELSTDFFDKFYNGGHNPNEPLEVKCIKKYIQNHALKHVPVDIDPNPNLSNDQIDYLFNAFKKYEEYKKLDEELYLLMAEQGFAYLNSTKCSELFDKKWITEKNLLKFMMFKEQLYPIHELFYKEQDERENAMLMNIYDYSKVNEYNRAMFLIGTGHRNSIVHKTSEYETKEKLNLNWSFYKDYDF